MDGQMTCEDCGRDVPAEAAFCPSCGSRLDAASKDDASADDNPTTARRFQNASQRGSGKQPPEEDLWSGTYSPKAMIGPAAGVTLLTILVFAGGTFAGPPGLAAAAVAALALWAILGLVLLYRRLTVQYRLTTFRLFHESGLLSRKRDRIEVIDINDVTLRQGIIERMFNTGTIHIESSDTSDPEFDIPGIDDVRDVADLIDNTRRAERQRRGLFMENI